LIVPAFTVKSSAATITGRPSIRPEAHHDRVGRRLLAADERAQLVEGAGIQQRVDARPDVELARGAVLGPALVAAMARDVARRCSRSSRTSPHSSASVATSTVP